MSKQKKELINIVSIPEDKTASITIGGMFYQRLNKLLIDHGDSVSQNNLVRSISMIHRNIVNPEDTYTFNLETIIILLRDVEKAFQDKGHAVNNEIEVDVPEDFKEMNEFAAKFAKAIKETED